MMGSHVEIQGGVTGDIMDGQRQAEERNIVRGAEALVALAQRFPQLYVAPAEDAQEAHRMAAGRGIVPEGANLLHFVTTDEDELRRVETPAGPVDVLFLKNRHDFETFLQIIGHKAAPVPIARTVGAITYRGIADWQAVAEARADYLASGGEDWSAEFRRLASQPGAFRAELIVISEGPYSNISADKTAYDEDEWVRVSREIRLHHECAHVVCRRSMPEDILPVWDEVTADVTGLICATGRYDAGLAALFLGVSPEGFSGGRLEEYLSEEQLAEMDDLSRELYQVLEQTEALSRQSDLSDPFAFLLSLKHSPLITY